MPKSMKKNQKQGKKLVGNQKEIRQNKNGRLDKQDFKMMRMEKKEKEKGKSA